MKKSKFFFDEEEPKIEIEEKPSETPKHVSSPDVKYCKKCGSENAKGVKFCGNCGNNEFCNTYEEYDELANYKYCYKCEKRVKASAKFCPECGSGKFMQTLEEVKIAKENSVHEEWRAKVQAKKEELEKSYALYEELKKQTFELKEKIDRKRYDAEKEKYLIEDKIAYLKEENSKKAADFDKQMNLLKNQIDYLKQDLEKLEKEKQNQAYNKADNYINADQIEKESNGLDQVISDKIRSYNDALRKNMIDEFNKNYPPIKVEKLNIIEPPQHEPYSKNNPYVYIGAYKGKPILWRVLDVKGNEALLLSEKILCAPAAYDLKGKFYDDFMKDFNQYEMKYILKKMRISSYNEYDVKYVGVLTHDEILKYLYKKDSRIADYDKENCKAITSYGGKVSWYMDYGKRRINGSGNPADINYTSEMHGFRPAMRIKKSYLDQGGKLLPSDLPNQKDHIDQFLERTFNLNGSIITRFNVAARRVVIPNRITGIENYAFIVGNSKNYLNSLLIPASIKTIGKGSFYSCSSLYELVIEDGVEEIESTAFEMSSISYLYIPDSVKRIGEKAFGWRKIVVSLPRNCKVASNAFSADSIIIYR